MRESSLELLAPRADVWAFLAEPYHLSDWWPGITGVDPDLRGFAPGARWRINLYRCDRAKNAFLAWSPTLSAGGFHEPEKFGILEFVK